VGVTLNLKLRQHRWQLSCRGIAGDVGLRSGVRQLIACAKCKEEKPDIEFLEANGRGRGLDGRYKWCRVCRAKTLPKLNALKSRIRKNQKSSPIAKMHAEEMNEVYLAREKISNLTGVQHHVEHVVPLSGDKAERRVCGLHVPWNVSLASAALNMSKGAKFSNKDAERVERDQMAWLRARGFAS
jgi:hypothetical protein